MSMILAVDIGNTRAKLGLFRRTESGVPEPLAISATPLAETPSLSDALHDWVTAEQLRQLSICVLAGSNPPMRDQLQHRWPFLDCPPVVVQNYSDVPLRVDVDEPLKVGIDRLLSAFAAKACGQAGQAAIIVDSGTAATVDLLTSDGMFRGGSIFPGLRLSAYALHDYTARLPLIDTDAQLTTEPPLPGRNTEEAICSGLFWGQLGAIRELVSRLSKSAAQDFAETQPPQLFITGGGGRQLMPHFPEATYVDSLALHGLAVLAARTIEDSTPAAARC